MPAPVNERDKINLGHAPDEYRADALGAVDLVRGEAHEVDVHVADVDSLLSGALRRVGMEEDAVLMADRCKGLEILHSPDLVVHVHDAHKEGVRPDGLLHILRIEDAGGSRIEPCDLEALALQEVSSIKYRLVLERVHDDVLLLPLVRERRSLECQVVALRGAGGEDYLARVGVDERGDIVPRLIDGLRGLPAVAVGL